MSRTELDNMWENMLARQMQLALSTQFGLLSEIEEFLEIKQKVLTFCRVINSCGLSNSPVVEWLADERKTFENILYKKLRVRMTEVALSETIFFFLTDFGKIRY